MISPAARDALRTLLGPNVTFDAPMSRCTSMRVGGPADAWVRVPDRQRLADVLTWATAEGVPVTVVGEGFNTVVTDAGLDGIALKLAGLRRLGLEGDAAGHGDLRQALDRVLGQARSALGAARALLFLRHPLSGGLGCAALVQVDGPAGGEPVPEDVLLRAVEGEFVASEAAAAVPVRTQGRCGQQRDQGDQRRHTVSKREHRGPSSPVEPALSSIP